MGVARSTVQRMYSHAKTKVADSLANGKVLKIEGGDYILCDTDETFCPNCNRHRHGQGRGGNVIDRWRGGNLFYGNLSAWEEDTLSLIEDFINRKGYKLTTQRREIIQVFLRNDQKHLTAEKFMKTKGFRSRPSYCL